MLNLTGQHRAFAHTAEPIRTFHIHGYPCGDQRITGRLRGSDWNFLPIRPFNLKGMVFPIRQLRHRKELSMQRRLRVAFRTGII